MSDPHSLPLELPEHSTIPTALHAQLGRQWDDFRTAAKPWQDVLAAAPTWRDSVPRVWACSDFAANTCIARPALIAELVSSGDLTRRYRAGEVTGKVAAALDQIESEEALLRELRQLRLREALRVAWRDLAGWADLEEVMATMSELADACTHHAVQKLYRWMCEQRGVPTSGSGDTIGLTVLGLGKLGGGELNFSSDIDLIFAYAEDGETRSDRPITNHEFFTKLGRQLIRALEHITEDGLVFRVDMRLRPNGDSGPLVLSFDATEHYYQTHGRDWERYALIKARVIAGDLEGGERLLDHLRPFVYRKYLDFGAFEAIRSMKGLIERELRRKRVADNIKLGQGGIREIEFIAQSFQLIRGGRDRALQSNHLLPTLRYLARSGNLTESAADQLQQAYVFLRTVEHRLQMLADRQTHVLPSDALERARLAYAMGHRSWSEFEPELRRLMRRVHEQFEQVFAAPQNDGEPHAPTLMQDLWSGALDQGAALKALAEAGYTNPETAWQILRGLRSGKVYQAHSKYGRERLDRLMPMLISAAGLSERSNDTLARLIRLIEAVGRRSVYLALLFENPLALSQLVKLSAASDWISAWISKHPLLLDELLDPISSEAASSPPDIALELNERLAQIETGDLESQMEVLREIRNAHVLRVAAADVSGLIDWTTVGRRLCAIAEVVLEAVTQVAMAGLQQRFGAPTAPAGSDRAPQFGIVAYGKLGSLELGYNSDLDLIFVHEGAAPHGLTEGGARQISNEQYYGRLAQRIVHILTTRTPSGELYEIDMRLRPSGRAGTLVTSIDAFRSYQLQSAWTWEHQALVRARPVTGVPELRASFEQARKELLTMARDPEALRRDVNAMRDRMIAANDRSDEQRFDLKLGRGGIVDIEFIVQYYVLRWAHDYPGLTEPRNNIDIIESLARLGLVAEADASVLREVYHRYLATEHRLKLADQPPLIDRTELADERRQITQLWASLFESG